MQTMGKTKIYQEKVSASENSVFKDNFSDLVNKICYVCRKMHTLLKKIGQTLTNKPTSFFRQKNLTFSKQRYLGMFLVLTAYYNIRRMWI